MKENGSPATSAYPRRRAARRFEREHDVPVFLKAARSRWSRWGENQLVGTASSEGTHPVLRGSVAKWLLASDETRPADETIRHTPIERGGPFTTAS